jgi:CheY-like chemotaxis protein
MERQVAHMVRLIDDLLDVSRITSGRIQLRREPTRLDTLLSAAIDANAAAIADKRIQLKIAAPDAACVLNVDPTRIIQVLSNLLHNATKFTPAGGSILVAAVVRTGDRNVADLRLSVRDSGIGIPEAFLPRVFDLFSQADRLASDSGLGIGLALAQRICRTAWRPDRGTQRRTGAGSEFIIRLPVSTQMPVDRPADPIARPTIDCRVIVIDDNRDAAVVTAMLIEELGGECQVAFDAESGLRAVRDYRPDVVVLDVGMAGTDGYETCRRIRREFGEQLTVVALTGFGQHGDKERAERAGFTAHLTKPADPAALMAILRRD